MKKFLVLILFSQFLFTFANAKIEKYLGDPNPVDVVYDCIDPTDNLKTVINIGFNKIEPLKTSKNMKKLSFMAESRPSPETEILQSRVLLHHEGL